MKLHLGCGKRYFPGWIHMDLVKYPHVDKLGKAHEIPWQDETFSVIYASHVLEYYDWQEADTLVLPEIFRVLEPGGTIRFSVPNFTVMAHLYCNKEVSLGHIIGPMYGKIPVGGDKYIYHKCVYDEETLTGLLLKHGFHNIHHWDWKTVDHGIYDDHSQAYIPHMDKENGTLISLNMEASKP